MRGTETSDVGSKGSVLLTWARRAREAAGGTREAGKVVEVMGGKGSEVPRAAWAARWAAWVHAAREAARAALASAGPCSKPKSGVSMQRWRSCES